MTTLDALAAHERAHAAFADVLRHVSADDLSRPTPCDQWTVADIVRHVTSRNQWIAGDGTELPSDLPGLREANRRSAAAAHAVFAAPDGLTRLYTTPLGDIPGSVFIGLRTTDALVHAWDLAVATNQPTDIDADVAEAMLAMSRDRVTPKLRGPGGPFGPEQPCDPSRPASHRLAAFLGRRHLDRSA